MNAKDLRVGMRVTGERKTWHDGAPVESWPNPQYVGTVRKVKSACGLTYALIRYDSGRTDLANADTLHEVPK